MALIHDILRYLAAAASVVCVAFCPPPMPYAPGACLTQIPQGIIAAVCRMIYNVYFHPLRSYPGPWVARASIIWFLYHTVVGDYTFAIHLMHLRYGPVIRIAPNELAYTDLRAWKDIYGQRLGAPENIKDPSQFFGDEAELKHPSIIFASRDQHSKIRRLISNAFSDKALREQEPILRTYIQLLVNQLSAWVDTPVGLVKWYNVRI